jgi:threonylcarbamoyladenosine tRNA methylthiotransferase MtaB
MARAITPVAYESLVDEIRELVPGIALTTDILTGFPGESDQEHQESVGFIQKMEFADGHVFTYSAREGTPAAEFPDQVPHPIRKERSAQIRDVISRSRRIYQESWLDQELTVLWEQSEKISRNTWKLIGLTDNYLKVESRAELDLHNRFSIMKLTEIMPGRLGGKILELA